MDSLLVLLLLYVCTGVVVVGTATMAEQCSNEVTKVYNCLNFATGKANTPTKECCTSVTEIKENHPVCLCYIIQQTHNGSEQIKSLGIQESRLIQLPSACQLANASLTYCPKLLNIPPSSPDYAIFTNSTATSITPSTSTGTSSTTAANVSGGRSQHKPQFMRVVAIAMAIFFCAFPVEVTSTCHT